MVSPTAQNDPVEKFLNHIIEEVEKETNPPVYASFLQRVISRLIDTAIILLITYSIQIVAFYFIKKDEIYNADYIMTGLSQAMPALAIMIWVLLYSPLMEASGGTVGKRIVGIKLVSEHTLGMPPYRNFMIRSWVYLVFIIIAVIPSILSCLAYFVSDKKQTWHDKLSEVVCIKK